MSSIRLPPLSSVKDLIKLYKLRAMKQLSQNFLLDARITDKLVRVAGKIHNHEVCEVGPGPGSITRSILRRQPSKLILIEKDPRFLPTLEMLSEASPVPIKIVLDDVLNFNMEAMFSEDLVQPWVDSPPDIHLIGNLPFNIATPLIIRWLHAISERRSAWRYGRVKLTLTFQKEVAERMAAPVMTKQRCRLSVMCQNWCDVNHAFTIAGKSFVPPPKVDVGVVTLTPVVKPIIDYPFKMVEKVVRCIFSFRQKYVIRGVELLFPKRVCDELSNQVFVEADIDPKMRPFMLTVSEIGRICRVYGDIISLRPGLAKYECRSSMKNDFIENNDASENFDLEKENPSWESSSSFRQINQSQPVNVSV